MKVGSEKDIYDNLLVMSLLIANNLELGLARKKRIGLHSWIAGGGDWAGTRHNWKKFSNNTIVSFSFCLCFSLCPHLSNSQLLLTLSFRQNLSHSGQTGLW